MASVIIIKDTNFTECTCLGSDSWLDHWELFKGIHSTFCRGCSQKTFLKGIHVLKSEPNDGIQYIVPLCDSCTKNDSEFAILSFDELVQAICPPPEGKLVIQK
jgi:hypothetical protein